jgi:hypothetical protein
MRKWWVLGCGIVVGLSVLVVLMVGLCNLVGRAGMRWVESLPAPAPKPSLVVGRTYWTAALMPPAPLSEGLVIPYVEVYNKPGDPFYPDVTIVYFLHDATPVKLAGIRDRSCYIEARDDELDHNVEGWVDCDRLLGYEPTPVPTPDRTPERP